MNFTCRPTQGIDGRNSDTGCFFFSELSSSPVLSSSSGSSSGGGSVDAPQRGPSLRRDAHAPFMSPQSNVYVTVWRVGIMYYYQISKFIAYAKKYFRLEACSRTGAITCF